MKKRSEPTSPKDRVVPPTPHNGHLDELLTKLQAIGSPQAIYIYVEHDSLKPAPWNPPIRIQMQYMTELKASMEAHGLFDFAPVIVDRNGVIADGHRRWTCAGLLRIKKIPCFVVDEDASVLWPIFNGTHMVMTGAQTLQAVAGGLENLPPKFAPVLSKLQALVGEVGMAELARMSISPHVYGKAVSIAKYCGLEHDDEFMRTCVFWLARHKRMNSVSAEAIREGVDPLVLSTAVRQNRPLSKGFN